MVHEQFFRQSSQQILKQEQLFKLSFTLEQFFLELLKLILFIRLGHGLFFKQWLVFQLQLLFL